MENNEDKGLGDKVESIIKTIAPKLAKRKENCKGCKKRKQWLNNFNATFG